MLGEISTTATKEWQQEIAAQPTQRNQILAANRTPRSPCHGGEVHWETCWATRGSPTTWPAGRTTGPRAGSGWIGDSYAAIEVPGAKGKCLDVAGGGKTNGTPVQLYHLQRRRGAAVDGRGQRGRPPPAQRRLAEVPGRGREHAANGTKIEISDCYKSKGQSWKGDVRGDVAAEERLHGQVPGSERVHEEHGRAAVGLQGRQCAEVPDQAVRSQGHGQCSYPEKAQFDKAKKGITDTQAAAKKQVAALKVPVGERQEVG